MSGYVRRAMCVADADVKCLTLLFFCFPPPGQLSLWGPS